MALTRKFLAGKGLETDVIEEIIQAHTETVTGLKDEIEQYKSYKKDAGKLKDVQKELNDLKADIEKTAGKNPYEVKYKALKEEFEDYKNDVSKKETKAKKEKAYKALLKEVGISDKRIDAVLKVSDVDSVELDDNGAIKDADVLKKSIKEEWADFIQTTSQKGANTANPPTQRTSGSVYSSKDEIMKIKDPTERQRAINDNIGLFQKGAQ